MLIAVSNIAVAGDKKVFVGYNNDNEKKYINWNSTSYDLAKIAYSDGFPKEISRHIVSCLNNMSWYKGELLKSDFDEGEHWYKFKFHWYLTSQIHYVDIRNGTMYCR